MIPTTVPQTRRREATPDDGLCRRAAHEWNRWPSPDFSEKVFDPARNASLTHLIQKIERRPFHRTGAARWPPDIGRAEVRARRRLSHAHRRPDPMEAKAMTAKPKRPGGGAPMGAKLVHGGEWIRVAAMRSRDWPEARGQCELCGYLSCGTQWFNFKRNVCRCFQCQPADSWSAQDFSDEARPLTARARVWRSTRLRPPQSERRSARATTR